MKECENLKYIEIKQMLKQREQSIKDLKAERELLERHRLENKRLATHWESLYENEHKLYIEERGKAGGLRNAIELMTRSKK